MTTFGTYELKDSISGIDWQANIEMFRGFS